MSSGNTVHDSAELDRAPDATPGGEAAAISVPSPHTTGDAPMLLPHPDQPTWRED